jgi:mannitol/fructose-specific phosphotransferase system IIA component
VINREKKLSKELGPHGRKKEKKQLKNTGLFCRIQPFSVPIV